MSKQLNHIDSAFIQILETPFSVLPGALSSRDYSLEREGLRGFSPVQTKQTIKQAATEW